jgi:hypothetical protein
VVQGRDRQRELDTLRSQTDSARAEADRLAGEAERLRTKRAQAGGVQSFVSGSMQGYARTLGGGNSLSAT